MQDYSSLKVRLSKYSSWYRKLENVKAKNITLNYATYMQIYSRSYTNIISFNVMCYNVDGGKN